MVKYIPYITRQIADGDSIVVMRHRETFRCRLAGIDCPEITNPYGREARSLLLTFCPIGTKVNLLVTSSKDRWSRLVAEAWLPEGIFINEVLIASGVSYLYPEYRRYCPHYSRLEIVFEQAIRAKKGFWKEPNSQLPIPRSKTIRSLLKLT
jgi:endonuclease YncB( thermonuclease family)